MKACVVLECEGRIDHGFTFCRGVKNIVLDLEEIRHTEHYEEIIEYLDKVAKIFDRRVFKNNIITNTIYKLFEMGYISETRYKLLCHFYQFHARCGLILYAIPKEIYDRGS